MSIQVAHGGAGAQCSFTNRCLQTGVGPRMPLTRQFHVALVSLLLRSLHQLPPCEYTKTLLTSAPRPGRT
jgi:hypothetical protein